MSTITFDQQEYEKSFHIVEGKKTYFVKITRSEDGEYIATCPEIQGVVTSGDTEEEAISNAYEAVSIMLEAKGIVQKYQLLVL